MMARILYSVHFLMVWFCLFFTKNEVLAVTNQGFYVNVSQTMCVSQMLNSTYTVANIYGCAATCLQMNGEMCVGFSYSSNLECNTFGIRTNDTITAIDFDSCLINSVIHQYFKPEYLNQLIPYEASPNLKQSSTLNYNLKYYYPSLAFDGDLSTYSCTNPGVEKPWLGIDLNGIYVIHKVVLTNVNDASCYRFHDIEVRVGWLWPTDENDSKAFATLCAEHVGGGVQQSQDVSFLCTPHPLFGKFVFVQIMKFCTDCVEPSTNTLSIAEVNIYGFLKPVF